MLVRDLITVSATPSVIMLSELAPLRERLDHAGEALSDSTQDQLRSLLEQYLIHQADNRLTIDSLLASLSRRSGPGGGFLISGVYGSGKSHLLSVIALLAEYPSAWPFFLRSHPQYRSFAPSFGPDRKLLVVPIPLDEIGGEQPLEEIFFTAIEAELRRAKYGIEAPLTDREHFLSLFERVLPAHQETFQRFLAKQATDQDWHSLKNQEPERATVLASRFLRQIEVPLQAHRSRAESFAALLEVMRASGFSGLVLLLDELSLFLAAKRKAALNQDAAFLQFLAQRSRTTPVWVIGALQRGLEDLGGMDAHTLRQIKDRFETGLTLSTAQLRAVISQKLIQQRDGARQALTDLYQSYAKNRSLSFSQQDFVAAYPVHPLTLDALERLADSHLSKTRSLIAFVQTMLTEPCPACPERSRRERSRRGGWLEQPADRLLTLDEVLDFFVRDLTDLRALQPHRRAWDFYQQQIAHISGQPELALAIVKGLLILAMADLRWSINELASSFIGSAHRELWGDTKAVRVIMEALRRRGAYLEVARAAQPEDDCYYFDLSSDVSEVVRRRLDEIASALSPDDPRITQGALEVCSEAGFPLASFVSPRSQSLEWLNTRRQVTVELRDLSRLAEGELSNLATALAAPASREDGQLLIAMPLMVEPQTARWRQAASSGGEPFAHLLLAWFPRQASEDELVLLREHAALRVMLADPNLRQSRLGREISKRLRERLAGTEIEVRQLIARLYREGEISAATGEVRPAPSDGDWPARLAAVFEPALRKVFADLTEHAPRARLLNLAPANQLVNQFLRVGRLSLPPGTPLEQHLRDYLEPLGLVTGDQGQFTLQVSLTPLVQQALDLLPERRGGEPLEGTQVRSYRDLERALAKSSFGLCPEQTQLLIAALIKTGYVQALDSFLQPLRMEQIGVPFAEHLPYLARTLPVAPEHQAALLRLSALMFGRELPALDLPSQEWLWERLLEWKQAFLATVGELRARLDRLIGALGQEPLQWSAVIELLSRAHNFADALDEGSPSSVGLESCLHAIAMHYGGDLGALARLRVIERFLREQAEPLADAHRYLTDPRFSAAADSPLGRQQRRWLELVAQGEALVAQAEAAQRLADQALRAYRTQYTAWHAQAHSRRRFEPYLELKQSAVCRALSALSPLPVAAIGEVDAALRQQLDRYCPGVGLSEALQTCPTCPACGLRFGQSLDLRPAEEIAALAVQSLSNALVWLHEPERLCLIQRRLAGESDEEVRLAVQALLDLGSDASAEAVLERATEQAVTWLTRCLAGRSAGHRRLADLVAKLADRELTRDGITRIFQDWLEAGEGDDYLSIV